VWEWEEIAVAGAGEVGDPWRAERLVGRSSALQVAYRRVLGSAVRILAVRSSNVLIFNCGK